MGDERSSSDSSWILEWCYHHNLARTEESIGSGEVEGAHGQIVRRGIVFGEVVSVLFAAS